MNFVSKYDVHNYVHHILFIKSVAYRWVELINIDGSLRHVSGYYGNRSLVDTATSLPVGHEVRDSSRGCRRNISIVSVSGG